MTTKDKAEELIDRFSNVKRPMLKGHKLSVHMHSEHVKQCALICVDEMLGIYDNEGYDGEDSEMAYLEEVKEEINKL